MKKLVTFLLVMKLMQLVNAQEGTYWQQNVDYDITVALDDVNDVLHGDVNMVYTNNSPDTLSYIWMHIWPNAYQGRHTELGKQYEQNRSAIMLKSKKEEFGEIDSLDFSVNGNLVEVEPHPDYIDVVKILLPEPLEPGATISIRTPFRVKIPSSKFSRLGHSGDAFQLTQWYPKPAVYDANGWNEMPYLNQGEFYSEFGDYKVSITIPSNYVVAASGVLQTESERTFLLNKVNETEAIESFSSDVSFPESSSDLKTIEYKLENAHDFAWFADKRFHVLQGEVTLPFSERKVETWSYFTNLQADLWMKSIDYINRSVLAYSNYVGEYQWSVAQALEGALSAGAGMEYPTITIIGESQSASALDNVITHEVGHNWFYGMLGSNERDYPWMDEGINSYYESRYMDTYYNNNPLEIFLGPAANMINSEELMKKNSLDLSWYLISGLERMNLAQPIEQHSSEYTSLNYGLIVYLKTAYLMRYMADFLGQGQFDRVMSRYFEEWKMKHPQPSDIKRVFEEETGEDMSWFFDGLLKDDRSLDYKIGEIQNGKNTMVVRVTNNTDIAAPFPISLMSGDSIILTEWHRGFIGQQAIYINKNNKSDLVTHVRIDANETIPDNNRENNTSKVKGIFKRIEPLSINPGFAFDAPYKTSIYTSLLLGGNVNDGFMLGLGVWNSTFPVPAIEWVAAPMYSFRQNQIVGQGSLGFNLYPENGPFSRLRLSGQVAKYHIADDAELWYSKIQPTLDIDLRKSTFNSLIQQSVRARVVNINERELVESGPTAEDFEYATREEWFTELQYNMQNRSITAPFSLSATVQNNRNFFKGFIELNYEIVLGKQKIETRFFAGSIFSSVSDEFKYQFSLQGVSSLNDYLYDEILPGRNASDGMWSNQISRRDGFFKLPARFTEIGFSNNLMYAFNLEYKIPKTPIAFFADAGYVGKVASSADGPNGGIQYDAGVMLRLINNYFEIYFPLLGSPDLADPFEFNYSQYILFTLNLNAANPFELLRKARF